MLIAEQAPDENLDSASGSKEETSKLLPRIWLVFFMTMFLIFGCYLAVNDRSEGFESVVFIALLLGMLAVGSYVEFGRKRLGEQKPPRPASSTNAPTTTKLAPQPGPEMNTSVTEQTTAHLAEKIEN